MPQSEHGHWQQPNPRQVFQEQQRQQHEQRLRQQEILRQQHEIFLRQQHEHLHQQHQERQWQQASALTPEESAGRSKPRAFPNHGGRPLYDDSVLWYTNAAPVSRSMDSLPSLPSLRGQLYPNSQQQSSLQFVSIGGGQSQGGEIEGASEYSRATAESSNENDSDTSDVAENPLIEGIDKDMIEAQHMIEQMYIEPFDTIEGAGPDDSFEIPFDPNLVCPKCGRQFRRGEIQKLRKHHRACQE